MTFSDLKLNSSLLAALPTALKQPTVIQQHAIPAALNGQDVLGLAQTGSGKTWAFGLPLLNHSKKGDQSFSSIIIAPTRELAAQIKLTLEEVAQPLGIKSVLLVGGVEQESQIQSLAEQPQIIVATPGRLLDLLKNQHIDLSQVERVVLDEADRLVDMGFWSDVESILSFVPQPRQTLCFSATLSKELEAVLTPILNQPQRIEAQAMNSTVDQVEEQLFLVNKGSKPQVLIWLLKQTLITHNQALVFISAKDSADTVVKRLNKAGILAAALHGNKEQTEREVALADFKAGKVQVLVATDVLARGVHIDALPLVINYDLPANAATYVHRVGRTARAGLSGHAVSLVCHAEMEHLNAIRTLTNRALPVLELAEFPVTDKPSTGEARKRPPRDKSANRRTAQKRSIKQFKKKTDR
ncbi:DEAD/DEAH box helicase [Vibrio sp. 10N.286.49.B3]|uniref:DEAD/DEAH box helicase n=1 Tax=Vibrio sp. 10N.286.49.B3 TaxID=1880855 RepID=UPI000C85BAF8|nr:DEAD/DEAH box helicase [Vibrio sp. 10N.286.49.B3]PMH44479.1 DEAD/DEAH box helicase [Vibrio sp. 10N.286.49.B3]